MYDKCYILNYFIDNMLLTNIGIAYPLIKLFNLYCFINKFINMMLYTTIST